MRPPCCWICHIDERDLPEGDPRGPFVLLRFRETEYSPPDVTGHPSNYAWYCARHAPFFEELTDLGLRAALLWYYARAGEWEKAERLLTALDAELAAHDAVKVARSAADDEERLRRDAQLYGYEG